MSAALENQLPPQPTGPVRGLSSKPKTLAEWKPYALRHAVVYKDTEQGPSGYVSGCVLIDVYDKYAIIVPPNHKHSEKVPLDSIKLSLKHEHQRMEREAKRPAAFAPLENEKPATPAPKHEPRRFYRNPVPVQDPSADHKHVVYCPATNGFLGGFFGKRNLSCALGDADLYANRQSSQSGAWYYRKHSGTGDVDLEYMTRAEARKMLERADAETKRVADDKTAADLATKLVDKALGREPEDLSNAELAKVAENQEAINTAIPKVEALFLKPEAQEPGLPLTPATIPATTSNVAIPPSEPARVPRLVSPERFAAFSRARLEEVAAEELALRARGERMRAEAEMDLDRMARAFGLV